MVVGLASCPLNLLITHSLHVPFVHTLSALHTILVKSALGLRMVSYQYPFMISDWPLGASVLAVGAEGLDSLGLNSTSIVDVSVMDEGLLHVGDDVASG